MTNKELIEKAIKARENAYSPYSNFKVGAALLCEDGKVFLGANIENCAYWPSSCAERNAIFSALSNGERKFKKLVVVGDGKEICCPCGGCRQVFVELLPDAEIICAKDSDTFKIFKPDELLPLAFKPDRIN